MSEDNQMPAHEPGAQPIVSHQMQRDLEIAAIQAQAKHHLPGIQRPPSLPPAPPRRALLLVGASLLALLLAGGITITGQVLHAHALARTTLANAVPSVAVVSPIREDADEDLVLPGSLLPFEDSPIYARTSGYLVRWTHDIGSHVKAGELLAEIDTPEIDQQLAQARATRQQIAAQVELAKVSSERWEHLLKSRSVSAQESDQQASGYQQAQASLAAADANVRRLEQLEGFKKVVAPFSGLLTKRNVDPGSLINAGAGAPGTALFDLARVDVLRVFTNMPQAYAPFIRTGSKAAVTLREFPNQRFLGLVARTAEFIDPVTRTMVVEVDLPNQDGKLLPGSYGEVHFKAGGGLERVTLPVNTMLFRSKGLQVAVVGPGGKVSLRSVSVGRDFGTTLEVLSGAGLGDQVVVNPPDSLEDGQKVFVDGRP